MLVFKQLFTFFKHAVPLLNKKNYNSKFFTNFLKSGLLSSLQHGGNVMKLFLRH